MTKPLNVLFLCTGNSARSILAETVLNHSGDGRFHAYSAGSRPTGRVNPHAIETLLSHDLTPSDARSKSWDEFAAPEAPMMDIIITVCDSAAGETCPIWPGHPMTAHWGMPDPAAATGTEAEVSAAFEHTFQTVSRLTERLTALPGEALAPERVRASLAEIGRDVLGEDQ